ncbi:MAG: hypothetical protein Q9213_003040 [Squamulea squamosa]
MRKYVVGGQHGYLTRSTSPAIPPSILIPSLIHNSDYGTKQSQFLPRKLKFVRPVATAAKDIRLFRHGVVEAVWKERDARSSMEAILHDATTTNQRLWTCLLEPYLPQHLQRKQRREVDAAFADADRPVPVGNLHIWLAEARRTKEPEGDLLTYLVVKEGRQDAAVWLIEAMLKEHAKNLQKPDSLSGLLSVSPRNQPMASLDDLTYSAADLAGSLDVKHAPGPTLDTLTAFIGRSASHECLGEIWRSIGSMILQAADHKPASIESRSIMTCVLRMLAHLYHFDAVPASIYNQTRALDPSVLQRPPTLYFWSLRMLGDLSDASFHLINPDPVANSDGAISLQDPSESNVTNLQNVDTEPLMPEVEAHIWLDFVLWCCVEGGWITEAAEIVHEIWTRSKQGQKYSVIDWDTLREQSAPNLPWSKRIKLAINGSRMREFAGGASLGVYDERARLLKPPERTVSSEVVAAIIDALVSTTRSRSYMPGNKPTVVTEHIGVCKNMLDSKGIGLESNMWDPIILRMLESLLSDSNIPQTFRIISWSPQIVQEPASANSAYHVQSTAQTYVTDPSAISIGHLHRLLLVFALAGNYPAALRIFQKLRNTVDANRRIMVTPILQEDQERAAIHGKEQPESPGLNLQLPAIVLAPFLELVTENGDFELGYRLLYSNNVDSRIITSHLFSDPVLQPALVDFASAAGDQRLLDSILKQVKAPLPERVLHAILHHQIRSGQWEGVHEVLELFRDVEELAWDATDVMVLAGAVLRLEESSDVSTDRPTSISPDTLLQCLMKGQYNTPHDPSQPRDFSQTRLLNQLARVVASVPSKLTRDLLPFCNKRYSQLSARQNIPAKAFNSFLSTVIELYGPFEGKRLCEQWLLLPHATSPVDRTHNSDDELVVEPNIQTYYLFLRGISQARSTTDPDKKKNPAFRNKALSQRDGGARIPYHPKEDEQGVIDWAAAGCVNLRLSLKRVKRDFPALKFTGQEKGPTNVMADRAAVENAESETAQVYDYPPSEQDTCGTTHEPLAAGA